MTSWKGRADKVMDAVTTYDTLKRVFADFVKNWKERCSDGIGGVLFEEETADAFTLAMFDGCKVTAGFSMIIKAGHPWGKVAYAREDGSQIGHFYFDQGGYQFATPDRKALDGDSCNITHRHRFPEIVIEFMETYLASFQERGGGHG